MFMLFLICWAGRKSPIAGVRAAPGGLGNPSKRRRASPPTFFAGFGAARTPKIDDLRPAKQTQTNAKMALSSANKEGGMHLAAGLEDPPLSL